MARVLEQISVRDPTVRVVDTHALPTSDPNGVDIFYLMLVATIVGVIADFQVRGDAGALERSHSIAFVAGVAVTAGLASRRRLSAGWPCARTMSARHPGARPLAGGRID